MIYVYSGIVGSGKTLSAVCDCLKYKRQGFDIFSNQYIKGTYKLPTNWYDYKYPENSLLVIDEAQLEYNCRGYSDKERKEVDKKVLSYLTMCRHYGMDILFITQSLQRLDVQIRELATLVYRFKKTVKLPYFNFKKFRFKTYPFFQIGRVFNDSVELDAYLNSSNGLDYGRLYLRFITLTAPTCYNTHLLDREYLDKDLVPYNEHKLLEYKGGIISC